MTECDVLAGPTKNPATTEDVVTGVSGKEAAQLTTLGVARFDWAEPFAPILICGASGASQL